MDNGGVAKVRFMENANKKNTLFLLRVHSVVVDAGDKCDLLIIT